MSLWKNCLIGSTVALAGVVYGGLAFGSVVLNGTQSLSHNGYFMLRVGIDPPRDSYVSFKAPNAVAAEFQAFSFVKRVAGVPGDEVTVFEGLVCIEDECRTLLPDLVARGFRPVQNGIVPEGYVAVFGDSEDSLDSRYEVVGLIDVADVEAVGFPIPFPHWRTLQDWMAQ